MFQRFWKVMNDDQKNGPAGEPVAPEAVTEVKEITIGMQEFEELKAKVTKSDEYWERLLRQTADFENFKKRAARERQEAVKFGNESLIGRLVPVLDNFEMALAAAAQARENSPDSLKTGVAMILTHLKTLLQELGLEEVDATGKPFDPNLHEAVSQQETIEIAEGHVVQQLRKGYRLKDRLIRPASVIVAKKPAG
jgi:molecular chaperone GrpE